ncbi:hypothetical protein [Pedobacter cryoconitis]|uniref:hypothetical protein n=1 Tax=Pedobacter cryoconitis TaxID=188932 RepID=UPI00161E581E|nr:hypothetical protein [Pedobacter cryoconitis]
MGTHQIILHTYCPEIFVNLNMERLTINIPETKSSLVKQILKELGVVIQPEKQANISDFRKKLANVSVWSDADLKVFEESKTAFENLKPQRW